MSQCSESTCQRNQLVVHCRHIKPTGNLCKTLTVISILLGNPNCSLAQGRGYVHILCYGEGISSAMSSWFVPAKETQLGVSIPCTRYTEPLSQSSMRNESNRGTRIWGLSVPVHSPFCLNSFLPPSSLPPFCFYFLLSPGFI